ncbi:unnamed protein product [Nyctereutes procyonoides]|uniref:(raccoon dog) hypothetical protein n=1 Tax=Nyctereutes procyonoides TaxID=34880 RepID=A0A811YH40_NYCPR|nr:unnamed protein product [Nyctereutes procyonoides]
MTVKKFWHRCTESELISRTSHCRTRTPPGTPTAAVSSEKESDTRGQLYLLVFVDTFPGWTEAFPTKHETAQTVTKKLLEDILPRYGFPVKIGSDNGPGFVSKFSVSTSTAIPGPCKKKKKLESPILE